MSIVMAPQPQLNERLWHTLVSQRVMSIVTRLTSDQICRCWPACPPLKLPQLPAVAQWKDGQLLLHWVILSGTPSLPEHDNRCYCAVQLLQLRLAVTLSVRPFGVSWLAFQDSRPLQVLDSEQQVMRTCPSALAAAK